MNSSIDHSRTYTEFSFKNIVHKIRMNRILKTLDKQFCNQVTNGMSYADVGCSNGYLTNIISSRYGIVDVVGYDHADQLINQARNGYSHIKFKRINLNEIHEADRQYDLVTCFETLEHVGNLESAVVNILKKVSPERGILFISVPVEIKLWGIVKYLVKMWIYRYSLRELGDVTFLGYLKALLLGKRLSVFRASKAGWSTHFGFDYRDIDGILNDNKMNYRVFTRFASRFYLVEV